MDSCDVRDDFRSGHQVHYLNVCHLTNSLHRLEVSSDVPLDFSFVRNAFVITPEMEYDPVELTCH